jgi:hypothetical protein
MTGCFGAVEGQGASITPDNPASEHIAVQHEADAAEHLHLGHAINAGEAGAHARRKIVLFPDGYNSFKTREEGRGEKPLQAPPRLVPIRSSSSACYRRNQLCSRYDLARFGTWQH